MDRRDYVFDANNGLLLGLFVEEKMDVSVLS